MRDLPAGPFRSIAPGAASAMRSDMHADANTAQAFWGRIAWFVGASAAATSGCFLFYAVASHWSAIAPLLAGLLALPRRSVSIVAGAASRDKRVLVVGLEEAEILARLEAAISKPSG